MHLKSVTLHPENYPNREKYPFSLPIFQQPECIRFSTPVGELSVRKWCSTAFHACGGRGGCG